MNRKVCAEPGCPSITDRARCAEHRRALDAARGTRQERGYDNAHDRERSRWQRILDSGESIQCRNPHCHTPSDPIDPRDWHLGHTPDRARWRGPEHPSCNLSEAGRARHIDRETV